MDTILWGMPIVYAEAMPIFRKIYQTVHVCLVVLRMLIVIAKFTKYYTYYIVNMYISWINH